MKKSLVALAVLGIMPLIAAEAAPYRSTTSQRGAYKTSSVSRKTGGYKNTITNNFYYNAGASQPVQSRKATTTSSNGRYESSKKSSRTTKRSTTSQERKFFLAHPFFQPLQGRFGSVTDVSYARANMDITLLSANIMDLDGSSTTAGNVLTSDYLQFTEVMKAKETTAQFAVKEDISYGLTDTLALMLMAQYDKTTMEIKDWSDGSAGTKTSTSGLNIFGIGLQGRFLDTPEYIGMLSGYFQHQKDAANTFMGELKLGTKINRTTFYGLVRGSYSKLDNSVYGAYMKESDGDWLMLSFNDSKDVFQFEGGVGAFAVFNKYLTAKAELTYGSFDWHNQLNLRGEFGIQPGDNFALNIYASTALYDSGKGKIKKYYNYDLNPTAIPDTSDSSIPADQKLDPNSKILYTFGDYKINKYNEFKVGVQGILYF
ncbi:MAG: hypothetical protein IKZ49_01655 [Alphaproteobacteria bacterium]|nr:hypothetical protein [Alphaproteobacteria bacterium]